MAPNCLIAIFTLSHILYYNLQCLQMHSCHLNPVIIYLYMDSFNRDVYCLPWFICKKITIVFKPIKIFQEKLFKILNLEIVFTIIKEWKDFNKLSYTQ